MANDNITVARAGNSENQAELLTHLSENFATGQFRLLVIDSICALFRVDYHGRAELNERQHALGLHLDRIKHMVSAAFRECNTRAATDQRSSRPKSSISPSS